MRTNKGTRASALPSRIMMNITSALPHPQSRNPHSVHNMGMVWLPATSYGMRTNGNHLEGLCSPDERTTLVLLNVSRCGGKWKVCASEKVCCSSLTFLHPPAADLMSSSEGAVTPPLHTCSRTLTSNSITLPSPGQCTKWSKIQLLKCA